MKKILLYILIFFSHYIQAFDKNAVFPPEGKYNKNISLQLAYTSGPVYFYFENSIEKTPLLFDGADNPVILSAAEGEEKNYKIVFKDKAAGSTPVSLNYTIDRKKPYPPDIILKEGVFSFKPSDNSVFFRIDRGDWQIWNNENTIISSFNTVFYYSQDSSGNKSIVKTWSNQLYENFSSYNKKLNIYSPAEGDFYNKQLLYIDNTGLQWVRYSFIDFDSSVTGTEYQKPLIIDRTGTVNLYIAAKPVNSDEIIYKNVSYNVNENLTSIKSELIDNRNSKYLTSVSDKIIFYSLNSSNYIRYEEPVKLSYEPDSMNFNTLKLKTFDDSSSYSYRYFFYFDNRKSNESTVKRTGLPPKSRKPPKPVLEGIKTLSGGGRQIYLKQIKDVSYLFTISENKAPDNPVLYDSISEMLPVIRNPYGRDSRYYIKVSSIDNYGNISDPLEISRIFIDHYPPENPEISVINNNLELKGKDDIYYRIITEGSIDSAFKKYSDPVSLQPLKGISQKLSVEYYSSDNSGNKSIISEYNYKADNSFPFLSESAELNCTNILNTDYILRKNIFNPDYDIFYTISDSIETPPDPVITSSKLVNDIILKCQEGEEKCYTLKILPVSRTNSNKGDITELNFHIDKIPPPAPVLSDLKEIYYSDNAVINIKGAVSGNTVYYSSSLNENSIDSPFDGKKAYDSTIVLSNPEKTRKTFYIKTGSSDLAGNRTVSERVFKVILDNRDYPGTVLENINDYEVTDSVLTVKKPDDSFIYRYNISNNKEMLPRADFKSGILDKDLVFRAVTGEEKNYYLSVKAFFDIYDCKGSEERIFFIKTDRKKPEPPVITISENNTIQLSGENKVLYSAFPEKTNPVTPEFKEYIKPFMLNRYIPPGRYNIKAYSIDEAGNVSDPSEDSFYVSRKIIYISASEGNDLNTGGLSSPVKTLKKALDIYRNDKIDTIYLLPGLYRIEDPLTIDSPLFIKGSKGRTVIKPDAEICESIFSIKNSVLILKDLNLISDNYCSNYFSSVNSLAVIDNSEINADSSRFVKMKESSLIIENTSLSLKSVFSSEPFLIESGQINITDSRFNISSSSSIKTFSLDSSSFKLKNSSFILNSDDSLFAESFNSTVKNDNLRVKIESSQYSSFYNTLKSRLFISNSFFSDSSGSDKSVFLKSDNSELRFSDSSVTLNSRNKSSFIDSVEGEYNLNRIMLIINAEENSAPVFNSKNAVFHIEDNDITLKNAITGGFITSFDSIYEIYRTEINNLSVKNKFLMDLKGSGTAVLKNINFIPDKNIIKHTSGITVLME